MSVEQEVLLVPAGRVVHGELWLVADDVVDVVDLWSGQLGQQLVLVERDLVA